MRPIWRGVGSCWMGELARWWLLLRRQVGVGMWVAGRMQLSMPQLSVEGTRCNVLPSGSTFPALSFLSLGWYSCSQTISSSGFLWYCSQSLLSWQYFLESSGRLVWVWVWGLDWFSVASSKMPMTDSKKLGMSVSYFLAYLMSSCLAWRKLMPLPLKACLRKSEQVMAGSISSVVLASMTAMISLTICSSRRSDWRRVVASSEKELPKEWHLDRSGFSHTLTRPSRSMQMRSSEMRKYPTAWYSFQKPSRALNSTQRFQGYGIS